MKTDELSCCQDPVYGGGSQAITGIGGDRKLCIDAGEAPLVCHSQIIGSVPENATPENTAIAYEPIWAIGSGKTPSNDEIAAMHAHIRKCLVEHLAEARKGDAHSLWRVQSSLANAKPDPGAGEWKTGPWSGALASRLH